MCNEAHDTQSDAASDAPGASGSDRVDRLRTAGLAREEVEEEREADARGGGEAGPFPADAARAASDRAGGDNGPSPFARTVDSVRDSAPRAEEEEEADGGRRTTGGDAPAGATPAAASARSHPAANDSAMRCMASALPRSAHSSRSGPEGIGLCAGSEAANDALPPPAGASSIHRGDGDDGAPWWKDGHRASERGRKVREAAREAVRG